MKKASLLLLFVVYLGVYGGRLALWNDVDSSPLKIFPYVEKMYLPADQQALRHGIPITSLSEAYRVFEDYFS